MAAQGVSNAEHAGGRAARAKIGPKPVASRRRLTRIAARVAVALLLVPFLLILLFRFVPVPITPLMLLRLAEGYGMQHHWVAYDRIAPSLAEAVVASEDNLFCRESFGFDWNALAGQFSAWGAGERPRGASTITMQTARNLLLLPTRDILRKAIEAWLTPQIALLWPKQRVMEVYLNIIEFGPGVYGADAAAHHFFNRPAEGLTRNQAALLATVLPDPLHRSAAHQTPYLRERVDTINRRVGQLGPWLGCLH
jgi:monofunctional biosynthetic peptidoglycan transglycosylase